MIHAALFGTDHAPRKLMDASNVSDLNLNLEIGETWREIPSDVFLFEDVPPLASLPEHPDLIERGA